MVKMFFKLKPDLDLKICVVLPVKDEGETILHCLDALRVQKHSDGTPFKTSQYEVLVLANNCRDNTYSIIKQYQNDYPDFSLQVEKIMFSQVRANIGTARRLLMDIAYNRFATLGRFKGIIASTDGDTQVDTFWLREIIKEIESGCDVVGGEIITELTSCYSRNYHLLDIRYHNFIARLEHLIDPLPYNPWPSHFQCFGASLAITCEAYEKAGRLPRIPFLEDVAFCKALELKDARIRRSPYVKVYTSSRTTGRVEKGLSQQLAWFETLSNEQKELNVECASSVISRIKMKKYLRTCWEGHAINSFQYPFNKGDVQKWISGANYFGEVWAQAEAFLQKEQWFNQWEDEYIEKVIQDLNNYEFEIEQYQDFSSEPT